MGEPTKEPTAAVVNEYEIDPGRSRGLRAPWLASADARHENDDAAKGRERPVKSGDDEQLVGSLRC